jgi:hypothetical protein
MPAFPYRTPAAFRAALTDRLKALATESSFTIPELQRQFAYDRLLARVFTAKDSEQWVLKGAVSLLARLDTARHSKDVDLAWPAAAGLADAERALRTAAADDLGDFFVFTLGPAGPLADHKGVRLPVIAELGGRRFVAFSVDVVGGLTMTAEADLVPPLRGSCRPGHHRAYAIVGRGRSSHGPGVPDRASRAIGAHRVCRS